MIPLSIQAGLWGLLSSSALLIGAAIGWFVAMPRKAVAAIMAFGFSPRLAYRSSPSAD